jgi:ribose transport system permease protein
MPSFDDHAGASGAGVALPVRVGRVLGRPGVFIWCALALLALACALFAPSTLKGSALLSMAPFASILAIAAIGQCLTIQQGGIDFSVAGSMSFAAVLVTGHADTQDGRLLPAIGLALGAVLVAGLLNGLAIVVLRITPIIATLAINAVLLGAVQTYTTSIAKSAPDNLSAAILDRTVGIPNTVFLAVAVVLVAGIVLGTTVVGRRFVAVGAGPASSGAAGLRVSAYVIATYMLAGLCFGVAGIALAGYVRTPSVNAGDPYLLSTVAAVVVGGTALGGGRGRVVGVAVAAVFLTQLDALLAALGLPASGGFLVKSVAIAVAVAISSGETAQALRDLLRRRPGARVSRSTGP